MKPISYGKQHIDENDIASVVDVLKSDFLTQGPKVNEFEDNFATYIGAKYAIAVSNGTAALHLALEGLNISPGAEVITPAFTFIASANAITFGGSIPIFADIDPETYTIDPKHVEQLITPKTEAILPVHIFGLPSNMKVLQEVAEDHNLVIIEDACQAHGAKIEGKHVGTMGDAGCFSFYATKNMITGEGGMIVTDNDELAERIRSIKNHGRGASGGYQHHRIGYNFRLADPLAAIGLIQLQKLPEMLRKRRENAESLRKVVDELDHIQVQKIPNGYTHSHYVFAPVVNEDFINVDEVIEKLRKRNIASRRIYALACHKQPTYLEGIKEWRWNKFVTYPDYSKITLPVTERISTSHFEIPVHPGVTETDIKEIQTALREIFS